MKFLILTVLSLTLIPQFILGQQLTDENIVPGNMPSGPCCNPAPAYSSWTLDIKNSDEAEPSDGTTVPVGANAKISVSYFVEKTNGKIYEKITNEAGTQIEKWYLGDLQYTKRDGKYSQVRSNDIFDSNFEYLPPSGFLGFDWLTKNNFVGFQKQGGRSFLVFKDKRRMSSLFSAPIPAFIPGYSGTIPPDRSEPVEVTAWVDQETRLPAKLQVEKQIRIFTFLAAPTTEIQLPSELAASVDQANKTWHKITRAAALP